MSVDVPHQKIQVGGEVDHRRCAVKAHVAERDEILAEREPAEGQIVAEKTVLEEEDDQSNCAANWQGEEHFLPEVGAPFLVRGGTVGLKDFEQPQGHQHISQRRNHKRYKYFLMHRWNRQ